MRRDEALRLLAEHRDEIRALGVRSLALFGSVARDEARPDSDVDVLVELEEPVTYDRYCDVLEYLEGLFRTKVDLATAGSVKPRYWKSIEPDLTYAS